MVRQDNIGIDFEWVTRANPLKGSEE